jgi:hypothetical protein
VSFFAVMKFGRRITVRISLRRPLLVQTCPWCRRASTMNGSHSISITTSSSGSSRFLPFHSVVSSLLITPPPSRVAPRPASGTTRTNVNSPPCSRESWTRSTTSKSTRLFHSSISRCSITHVPYVDRPRNSPDVFVMPNAT